MCLLFRSVVAYFFLAPRRFLRLEPLRREIHEGLRVIENWNSANDFILYARAESSPQQPARGPRDLDAVATPASSESGLREHVLTDPMWSGRLTAVDLRALSPLKWQHVNPYGTFTLNMGERLPLAQ